MHASIKTDAHACDFWVSAMHMFHNSMCQLRGTRKFTDHTILLHDEGQPLGHMLVPFMIVLAIIS